MCRLVLQDSDLPYLDGTAFSNARAFRMERTPAVSRTRMLADLVRGQCVLHVGFADHLQLIGEKRSKGVWLHDVLSVSADRVVGVDLDEGVVDHLARQGMEDIHALDLTSASDVAQLGEHSFDVVVLGEVLEHIGDPVTFLRAVREGVGRPGQRLIVTVPNAWNLRSILNLPRGVETVNTDHRFWFTPYTLAKVINDSGWTVDEIVTVISSEAWGSLRGRAAIHLMNRYGLLRPTVVGLGHLVH